MTNPRQFSRSGCSIIALVLLAVTGPAAGAEKTDVVYLRNGDRITCEIKNLERGQLKVKTDSIGTIYFEWKDIARVTSKELYVVELEDGSRLQGTLAATDAEASLLLEDNGSEQLVAMQKVVWLDPLKLDERIIKRWDGSVSVGFDTTKANNDTSITASFDARRRAERFILNFDGSVYSRSQDDADDSLRANFGTVYRRLLENRWYWAALGGLERNDELGIDLRSLAGGGYGRFLLQTGRTLWSTMGGLVVVNEQRAGTESADTNVEGFLNMDYEYFTYDTPKTTIITSLTIYPGVTDSGRFRSNLDLSLRRELITDLFVELSVYDSYDNDPPEDGTKNDYGIVTSLGYTF